MGRTFDDYKIPEGYEGVLYAGDVFLYYGDEDEFLYEVAGATSLGEYDPIVWFEDLEECIEDCKKTPQELFFKWPHQDYRYARIIVDGIELNGTEIPGETGWNYGRLAWPAYVGEVIENPDYEA